MNIWSWLDVLALLSWGALLLKYIITGQLNLLIHPDYFWLVYATSATLLSLGIFKGWQILQRQSVTGAEEHAILFPPQWSSGLLILTAILGLAIAPKVLTSQTALQRGVTDLPMTRSQPQSFRATTKPEERSLIEWVRTLNAYPEPDAYAGQPAKVQGFVIHAPELPDSYLLLSRFIITCCAVDAYPVGIPVKLEGSHNAYPPDTWLEVEGEMISTIPVQNISAETSADKRRLVLAAKSVEVIPTPNDPYGY